MDQVPYYNVKHNGLPSKAGEVLETWISGSGTVLQCKAYFLDSEGRLSLTTIRHDLATLVSIIKM